VFCLGLDPDLRMGCMGQTKPVGHCGEISDVR
jgi:hypothetical protein